jgi:EAL domain-containing protein (putative c-di-GMP-specific phosphodiesterase class I)
MSDPVFETDSPFTFAFQPIFDARAGEVFSYEALVRGLAQESAYSVLNQIPASGLPEFDLAARVKAIKLATRLGIGCHLNLNFMPQTLERSSESILSTLDAANRDGLPIHRIVLEVVEGEIIHDHCRFTELINEYRGLGLKVAIDDFGAGYSGLNLLVNFQPDQVKLDMQLIRGIASHGPRQSIVRAIVQICSDLGIDTIAEGVETEDEYEWLINHNIHLYQGYLFARPGFECLPAVQAPGQSMRSAPGAVAAFS